MKTSVKVSILTMLFGLSFIGCNNTVTMEDDKSDTPEVKDFVLTYSVPWDYFSIPWNTTVLNPDTLFVINTRESFAAYFPTAASAPDNFTDYSLLFVYGKTANKIVKTSYQIDSDANGTYCLDVDIELGEEQAFDVWYVSILVPKIPDVSLIPYKRTFSGAVLSETPNENNPAVENPYRDDITGKWKLLSVVTAQDSLECSGSDIIYNFSTKDKLTVTGFVPGSLPEGEYTYEYRQPNVCPTCTPAPYNMQIGDDKNLFCEAFLKSEKMIVHGERAEGNNVLKWTYTFTLLNKDEGSKDNLYNSVTDTLQGNWQWVKTYTAKHGLIDNEFKSVLNIKKQNENSTVNYEIYVADTLFSSGFFSFLSPKYFNASIVLPHFTPNEKNQWNLSFHNENWIATKDTICFFSGNDDDNVYYYKKITQ